MAKWYDNIKSARYSKNGRRFLGSFDIAEAKRMESIKNSEIKRGVAVMKFHRTVCVCSCGVTGCIFYSEW